MRRLLWLGTAFLLGAITAYNIDLHTLHYRISYYGYAVEDGKPMPVIKLRRSYQNDIFHITEPGRDVEVATMAMRQSFMFTDKEVDAMMKKRYCK